MVSFFVCLQVYRRRPVNRTVRRYPQNPNILMRHYVTLLAFLAMTSTSLARADESILERLRETGVQFTFERVGGDSVTKTPTEMLIPNDWKWTDQAVMLVRELISATDTPLTIYLTGPRVSEHKKVDSLKNEFSRLSVKRIPAVFLGVACLDDLVACRVQQVFPDTTAESAGLKRGDTIVGVNQKKVDNFKMLRDAMLEFIPDDTVEIHVKRESEDLTIHVTLAAFPPPPKDGEPSVPERIKRF